MSTPTSVIIGTKPKMNYMMAINRISKISDTITILARGSNIPKALSIVVDAIANLPDKWTKGNIVFGHTELPYRANPNRPPLNKPPETVKVIEISVELKKQLAKAPKAG